MASLSRLSLILATALLIGGCSPFMVPVKEVDGSHPVQGLLTKEQVKEAIMDGAESVGWRPKNLGNDMILATHYYKGHTVHVEIGYTDSNYETHYKFSNEMKMFCTERDKQKHQGMIVSGRKSCPGNSPPAYIHKAYKQWVDALNQGIQNSLASY